MKTGKSLLLINFWLFIFFGLGFAFFPQQLAELLTGAAPATSNGVIDMRSTYGGMALGLAVIFGLCASDDGYITVGLQGVLAVMTGLAVSRTTGILLDGSPNLYMYALLTAEVLMGVLAFSALAFQKIAHRQ